MVTGKVECFPLRPASVRMGIAIRARRVALVTTTLVLGSWIGFAVRGSLNLPAVPHDMVSLPPV